MYDIDNLPGLIELGHLTELGVSAIEFDVSTWATLYPTKMIVKAKNVTAVNKSHSETQ